ncbi:TlpA family protein disulfide reductase [Brevibacillus ginsengisoli]|uniref:TlpA family protein disulfide reductase n=1 Tax=Brevibacillus ginsengisoli TaxID=363854 RepID=UPI003CEEB6C6
MRKILIFVVLAILFGSAIYSQMKHSQLQTQAQQQLGQAQQQLSQVQQQQTQEAGQLGNGASPSTDAAVQSKSTAKQQASSFSLKGIDGKTYRFEGPREKPIVINFWASWCGPCREEAPDLKKLSDTYKEKVDIYAVNLTSQDNRQDVNEFIKKYQFDFPILLDEKGEVADRYKIQAIPTTFFIDKQGIVQQTVIGMIDPSKLDQYVSKILP